MLARNGMPKFMWQSQYLQSRAGRNLGLALIYGVLFSFSLWFSYQLRFDFFVEGLSSGEKYRESIPLVILWVVPMKLLLLIPFGQYSGLLSYFGTPDLYRLARSIVLGTSLVGLVRIQNSGILVPPRGVILIDFLLAFVLLAVFRIGCRAIRENLAADGSETRRGKAKRIGIIGAGDLGASLAKELLNKRGMGRIPVAFFDDDGSKQGTRIHNISVIGKPEELSEVKAKLAIDEVVIAMPSSSPRRRREVIMLLQQLHLRFVTVPSVHQMTTGKVRISQLRPVEIQDLLGREPVNIERNNISPLVSGKVVAITGAGGSIGGELSRQIASFNPKQLLLIDHSEYLLFVIEQELLESGNRGIILPLVANILDSKRIEAIFRQYRPDIVFHAAALKHVPMMESQPGEAVKVNTVGTARLARLAANCGVSSFLMISTDKAVNPTSVMGATKRLAEKYVQGLSEKSISTRFMAVRFGNVLGSSGSVIPTFERQIAAGGPVKVTHPDVTRFFMTIPEAVGLVLQCGAQAAGGEIFVLDMGEPVRIVDLARQLIELSGFVPDEDIEIEYIGLRPGEKLFEELQHSVEDLRETEHPKIMRMVCEAEEIGTLERAISQLSELVEDLERDEVKKRLKLLVPEYQPFLH
jgi:FlaA1/EpsC-like NDP-sugar epimerase